MDIEDTSRVVMFHGVDDVDMGYTATHWLSQSGMGALANGGDRNAH
jgi:hypothetical protein